MARQEIHWPPRHSSGGERGGRSRDGKEGGSLGATPERLPDSELPHAP